MLVLELNFEDGERRVFEAPLPVSVGRSSHCDLHLKAWRVGRHHANFVRTAAGVFIEDLGTLGGTLVNGKRVTKYGPLTLGDEIIIRPCLIRLLRPYSRTVNPQGGTGGNGATIAWSSVVGKPVLTQLKVGADAACAVDTSVTHGSESGSISQD